MEPVPCTTFTASAVDLKAEVDLTVPRWILQTQGDDEAKEEPAKSERTDTTGSSGSSSGCNSQSERTKHDGYKGQDTSHITMAQTT